MGSWLVGEPRPRKKILPVLRIEIGDVLSSDGKAAGHGRVEFGEVLIVVMDRARVFVTQAIVDIQLSCDLPTIMHEEIEAIDSYETLRITLGDGGLINVACQEVGQRENIVVDRLTLPGTLKAVEYETASSTGAVEAVHAAL